MVDVVGFTNQEEAVIKGMMARFGADNHRLGELLAVAKADMPGYNGKVVPRIVGEHHIEMTMLLSSCAPFTVAHELAHVSDIACRRQETKDNLSLAMPAGWHLAHRMSAEYYANRVACGYSSEAQIFEAFQNDHNGFAAAAHHRDWSSMLIHYALMLGIFHGLERMDMDPVRLLRTTHLPDGVMRGLGHFRDQACAFFDGHAASRVVPA